MTEKEYIEGKNLFDEIKEGDEIVWESKGDKRENPLTVYRHVTEEDKKGQLITFKQINDEEHARTIREYNNIDFQPGDLMTTSLTNQEFLLVRGPQDGVYALTQNWTKNNGIWVANILLWRHNREANKTVWTSEKYVKVYKVSEGKVNRDDFDYNCSWVPGFPKENTVWESVDEGEKLDF